MNPLRLADRARALRESPTLAVKMEASRLRAEGVDVIDFGPGEPDFPTPAPICRAAEAAIAAGHTHYTDTAGILELRSAIARTYGDRCGTAIDPAEVLTGCGGKNLLFLLNLAMFQPGDRVVLFAPYWVSFPEQIRLAGAEPVVVNTTAASGFRPTAGQLERVCDDRTRAVILNSPCNPTGAIIPRAEQERFVSLVERRGLLLISDECYDAFVYGDDRSVSFLPFRDRIGDRLVIVNSFSKTYAMTGWRVGFLLGPPPVVKAVKALQSHDATHTAAIAQWAAIAALEQAGDSVVAMREEFRSRRDLLLDRMGKIPGITCMRPEGAFYAFPGMEGLFEPLGVDSTRDLAARLIRDAGIATVPGEAFGCPGHLRLSYALSRDRLEEGLERLRRLVETA